MTATSTDYVLEELTGSYQFDLAHTRLGFAARHALVAKVHGWFDAIEGELHLDADDPTKCSAALVIDAASIRTNNTDRDAHLRSADFFDVERHPTITFASTAVENLGHDRYRVTGDFTVKGITRGLQLDVVYHGSSVDPYGQVRVGFEGSGSLSRSDWGLTWNMPLKAGGLVLSDRIDLEVDVAAVKVR